MVEQHTEDKPDRVSPSTNVQDHQEQSGKLGHGHPLSSSVTGAGTAGDCPQPGGIVKATPVTKVSPV